jgi:hypothetical protein
MTASDGLQFERAEFDQAPTTGCTSCKAPLVNGFASLTRPHRVLATASLIVAWIITQDGIVMLAALVAVWR